MDKIADEENERIRGIIIKARSNIKLLQNYNETKMNEFMASKENLLLLEYFLQNQKQFFLERQTTT